MEGVEEVEEVEGEGGIKVEVFRMPTLTHKKKTFFFFFC